jgi:RNA polymerase sigma-70 factor, ECF subfamily
MPDRYSIEMRMMLPPRQATIPQQDPSGPADAELMRRLARGDMNALAVLVKRHQDVARRVANWFTGRWDVADDMAQDAFLRLYRGAASYKPTAAFSTWLYRIVVNLCLDHAKRPRLAALPDEPTCALTGAAPDEALRRQECRDAVRREIAALPERQRIALVLHRFERLDHAQIAQSTGWSESAIESLLVRAYAQLRQRLQAWATE